MDGVGVLGKDGGGLGGLGGLVTGIYDLKRDQRETKK